MHAYSLIAGLAGPVISIGNTKPWLNIYCLKKTDRAFSGYWVFSIGFDSPNFLGIISIHHNHPNSNDIYEG